MDEVEMESKANSVIKWNKNAKLIISDVDETIADLYVPAEPAMVEELSALLQEGKSLFFVTGQSIKSLQWRIVYQIPKELRKGILLGHCSGAEVWGHDNEGNLKDQPFYSVYETAMTQEQKDKWRDIIKQLVSEFQLEVYDTMPVDEFKMKTGDNPRAVMLEDRGPQITFEVVNGYDLTPEQTAQLETEIPESNGAYDLRIPIVERAQQLLDEAELPVTPRIAGVFAVDLAVKGVSKTTSVRHVLGDEKVLSSIGLTKNDVENPQHIEVWGDKFSTVRGGTDRHISEALPKSVRSVDFREENPEEFEPGYNIVVWQGKKHLHQGLLEYLKARHHS
ncbi:hypothetical protein A3B51_02210 [Candidatus Curtissbacteria bacterium RIFCSPLOWO2_01_FULL_41_18]|uniref:Sucrose phosphatase-like domain-containing protein n=2 Tax=Candidatus Curtissiibacteriota TaxID=1752717 RepID=A0A1F5G117_9BACT|nr:MAG: hypothetical protein A2696_03345 [Candidatus Curtissbacteria bacterium RIFCSPHIGHO2_01_FULL_41_13]OGE04382.1 MAG: hypothetical protein A3B51_02210 [Candidatus Curtissbacteria bacterium RIFCSPLOWO2_01_FULL_41_18]